MSACVPADDERRLEALRAYEILILRMKKPLTALSVSRAR